MFEGEEGFVTSSPKVRNCGEAAASSGGVDLGDLKAAPATATELAPPSAVLSSGGETMSESEAENPQEQQRQRRRGVKFLCSFGGSILPRPYDGKLRYVGGETRIVRVSRDISFPDLVLKMAEFYDQPFTIKYQLPEEEDLDALVSVLSNDDLSNMMEEYDKLEATDGFTRLRLFLFSAAEQFDVSSVCVEADAVDQRFVEALNWLSIPDSRRSESYNSLNSPDGGSIARRITRQQEIIHVASPPLSPMSHPRQPSSPFSLHQIDDLGDVQQQQQLPWTLGSHLRMQDLMLPRSCPFQEPMPKYKHSVKVFPSNEGYCGNSPEYESPRELNRIEAANQWPEANNNNNQPFGPDISPHVHQNIHYQNMQNAHLVQQQHQHQHQGYCVPDVYPNPEVVSPGRKLPVPPVNYGILCETLEQSEAQHHHRRHHHSQPYPPENYEGEKSWHHHVSSYHASPHHPETVDYEFSSSKLPQGIPIPHGEGLGRNLIHHAASTNDLDRFAEGQKHMQGVWPHDCGVLEAAKYENRLDYAGKAHFEPLNSLSFGGRNIEQNEILGLTGHNMSQMHGRFQRSVSALEYQQERQIAYEARYAAIFRENPSYFQDQHGPNRVEQQIHNPHSVSKEGLPIQHGPNRIEQQIHNPHSVSKEGLPIQNAGRKVDHRLPPSLDQVQIDTGHWDRVDRARAWVLHSTNYHRDTTQRPVESSGVLTAEEGILKDAVGQNCYSEHNLRSVKPDVSYHDPTSSDFYKHPTCDRYESSAHMPQFEPSAHMPHNLQRLMIDSHLDNDSVFHQGFGGGQSHWCCERKNQDSACVQKNHTSYNTNADDIHNYARAHVPDEYMHKEIAHISNYGGAVPKEFHQDSSSDMAQVIQGVSSMIVSSHYQTESGVLGEQISDVFTNSEGNVAISDNACPHIRAPSRVFLPDSSLTLSSSLEVLSSPLSSDGPPIYDRSPESSIKITAQKDLLFENGVILINKSNPEMKDFGSEQFTEKLVSKMEVARDENLEKGTRENSLNDRSEVDASRRSCAMKSQEQGSILISSTTNLEGNLTSTASVLISSTTSIERKQVSTASAKGGDCNEVEQEAFTPGSNVKDGLQEEKPPQDNKKRPINGSVNMEKNNASLSEADALAQGLQTIRNDDLEEVRELGSGTYGTVYYGKWKGSDVAIKRIKASCFTGNQSEQDKMIADFWKEACMLSQLHHPNVVAFYGVVRDGPDGTLATVTEYMVNGSLKQVLHKKDRTIDRRKRLIIARDVAFGMEYLHSKNIVHFDLKCDNLLVNMKDPHRPICKIGDLGLSKIKQRTLVSGGVRGTLPWMAPELLSGETGMVTEKVDVYSFGIVMWELLTGEEPYANMHCGEIIGGILNNTLRPTIPDWCREPAWRSLMERCWSHDPGQRPSFSEIATELRAMGESMNVK